MSAGTQPNQPQDYPRGAILDIATHKPVQHVCQSCGAVVDWHAFSRHFWDCPERRRRAIWDQANADFEQDLSIVQMGSLIVRRWAGFADEVDHLASADPAADAHLSREDWALLAWARWAKERLASGLPAVPVGDLLR